MQKQKEFFLNEEMIAIDQNALGKQGELKNDVWNVLIKPLSNGDYAIIILNRSNVSQTSAINFSDL